MLALPSNTRSLLTACVCVLLVGCGSFTNVGERMSTVVTPYRVEVVQGNFVSREQVAALQPGMTRLQVREALGTPLITSLFHENRWDYVFTIRRQGMEAQQRRLSLHFEGDKLQRFEGDEMPTEAEFVGSLDRRGKPARKPVLEASEETLRAAAVKNPQVTQPTVAAPAVGSRPPPATPTVYPPLEPAAR